MNSVLLAEDRGPVRVLIMNRPEKRNALDNALTNALIDGLRTADGDRGVGSIVLSGAGAAFCAGADMNEFKDLTPENQHFVEHRAALTTSLHALFPKLSKPVVTAINGAAMGGGAGLALAGDMAIMGESARIGYPEVKHGLVAAIVMTNLVRQIGRKAAFELVGLAQPIDAHRALALGMVNRVVPDGSLLDEALRIAAALAALPRAAMATTKALFYEVAELPFDDALAAGRQANQRMRAFSRP